MVLDRSDVVDVDCLCRAGILEVCRYRGEDDESIIKEELLEFLLARK